MKAEKRPGSFPVGKIKASLIAAVVIFAVCGLIMKNQAYLSVKCASLAASRGNYDMAIYLLNGIDMNYEAAYYNEGLYRIADSMYRRGAYELAAEKFSELADYSDSGDMVCRCRQKIAGKLIEDGDYKLASAILSEIMYFEGSRELFNECQYRYAAEQIANGEWFIGAQILWGIRDYRDSEQIAKNAVYENTGSEDAEKTLGEGGPMSPEELSDYLMLCEIRSHLKNGSVAVGFYHTAGLNKNGTVIACGNNKSGQCDTSSWQNVVQIAAGGLHTVGLLSDGTVVACGDNTYGQCNVAKWKNVLQIAATDYNTVALLSDGKVVTCGYNKLPQTKGWTGTDRIAAGSYAVCCLSKSREYSYTHPSCKLEGDLIDADLSISYAIGLTVSGEVLFSSNTPCEWDKAAAVYAGGETVGIIDRNLKPSVFNRRTARYCDIQDGKAVSMSLGGTHFAVLYSDGRVYCSGENDDGQCDTSGWNLN